MEDCRGQPPKIAQAGVKERFLTAIAKGASYQIACGFAGFSYNTLRRWMLKGEALLDLHEETIEAHEDKIYYDFYCEVKRVESYAALKWLDKVDKASDIHWQAAAWKLERRYPHDFGKVIQVDIERNDSSIEKAKEEVAKLKGDNHGRSTPTES